MNQKEVKDTIEIIKKKYTELYALQAKSRSIREEITELENNVYSNCEHEMVIDRSYASSRTVWTCKICGF